jgi:hypothetical protein
MKKLLELKMRSKLEACDAVHSITKNETFILYIFLLFGENFFFCCRNLRRIR